MPATPLPPSSTYPCAPRGGDDGHVHIGAHERDDVPDHLVVVLHVRPVRIQRAVRVKGDQVQALRARMHLRGGGRRAAGSFRARLQSFCPRTAPLASPGCTLPPWCPTKCERPSFAGPALARPPNLRDVEDVPDLRKVGRHILAAGERKELVVLLERLHQPAAGGERRGVACLGWLPPQARGREVLAQGTAQPVALRSAQQLIAGSSQLARPPARPPAPPART